MTKMTTIPDNYNNIRAGIVELLKAARSATARNVNSIMTAVYWDIGRRIVETEQAGTLRANYGDELIKQLANDLSAQFGRGFGVVNLSQMRRFFLTWPQKRIFQTPSEISLTPMLINDIRGASLSITVLGSQFPLPWSAYVRLLSVKSPEARTFYEAEALRSGWSVRQLDRQIASQFYERIALSKNKAALLEKAEISLPSDLMTPEDAIKDPFVLEFLDLKDEYSESDLEDALIRHLTDFLLELGDDFAFLGRQRRLRIDETWFRIDLVFFHRGLRCLVVIDLKVGKFSYADAGQMHLYLNYASEHWMKPGENPPVGLILCAEKGASEAHYALDNLPNKVLAAEYQTVLPDEKLIAEELERSRRELDKRASVRRVHRKQSNPQRRRRP
ncbi:MAG: PDDEXK nuclease domain-containing protein [Terriglobales bacterium]|jgi:predicted nuclease of restriction endonuclease-like (RecB) superfamily